MTPEPEGSEPDTTPKPHPLSPGGDRFQQIYARWKHAEERNQNLEARLLSLEESLRQKPTQPQTPVYTDEQLETMIINGQITRGQADGYRAKQTKETLKAELKAELDKELAEARVSNTLVTEFNKYVTSIPSIATAGSPERVRVDTEFDWLVSVYGLDPQKLAPVDRQRLALNAVRNVFGPISMERSTQQHVNNGTHQGSFGGNPPMKKPNPDQKILNDLTPKEVEHYKKLMKVGKYPGGWKDVVAEIKYVPGPRLTHG
ncbi:MAG: hypothetical protein L0287_32535 [Anaerolineae bacterium]|nr:hypothetical protein [Anaerolineae bacterium]